MKVNINLRNYLETIDNHNLRNYFEKETEYIEKYFGVEKYDEIVLDLQVIPRIGEEIIFCDELLFSVSYITHEIDKGHHLIRLELKSK